MALNLEKSFDEAMLDIYRRAKSEAKYNATRFLEMLHTHGGLETARILINDTRQSDGYTELYLRGKLDLTVEAVVIDNPKWHSLFTKDELEKARKRLADNGYFSK
tara:strand:+ start:1565 stop:1879 length:315 start_codon:yes stop_codon:yes gene_type:complete